MIPWELRLLGLFIITIIIIIIIIITIIITLRVLPPTTPRAPPQKKRHDGGCPFQCLTAVYYVCVRAPRDSFAVIDIQPTQLSLPRPQRATEGPFHLSHRPIIVGGCVNEARLEGKLSFALLWSSGSRTDQPCI